MVLLGFSILSFALAFFFFRKTSYSSVWTTVFCILALLATGLYGFYSVSDYFTGNGITSATIYSLQFGLGGAGFLEYWKMMLVVGVGVLIVFVFLYYTLHSVVTNHERKVVYGYAGVFLMFVSVVINPATFDLYEYFFPTYPAVAAGDSGGAFFTESGQGGSDTRVEAVDYSFQGLYKQPHIESVGKHRNFVMIYVEGLEQTYSNHEVFPGLTPGLDSLAERATVFTDIRQTDGADFTIAGMVASQCGVPLYSPSHGNSMSGVDEFLPSARCLGDLLHAKKYYLAYYGGASLEFAGKGTLYDDHGFDEVMGSRELLGMVDDPSYKTSWGLYDDSLFDIAYERFEELSETEKRFGMMMLTLDTHAPKGHPSKRCDGLQYGDGENDMLNAVICTDKLVTEFVKKIEDSQYGDNTVIVITSDHLGLRSTATNMLDTLDRRNRLMVIDPDAHVARQVDTTGSTLDTGTTLLPFFGFDGEIGLGRNLLDPQVPGDEIRHIQNNVRLWKPYISQFWDFPRITKDIVIDPDREEFFIGHRSFRTPALVELDSYLNAIPRFQFNSLSKANLHEQVQMLGDDTPFLLIHRCEHVRGVYGHVEGGGYCLVSGRGQEFLSQKITGEQRFSAEEIKRMTYFQ